MRLIDANIFEETICDKCNIKYPCKQCKPSECELMQLVRGQKTVDAVPVAHGYMEQLERITIKVPHCRCSACNKLVVGWKSEINFCPNCGARMDGEV